MNKNVKSIVENEIQDLLNTGIIIDCSFVCSDYIRNNYQVWFTKACKIVELLLPSRIQEFKNYYYSSNFSFADKVYINEYRLQTFFNNIKIYSYSEELSLKHAKALYQQQISILKACQEIVNSKLNDIEYEMFIELNETELDTAKSLLKINLRASGCIAGVVLEKYLKSLLFKYNPNHGKKDNELTLNVINELLKEKAYDTKTFKNIQYLSDIRNLCDHDKKDSFGKTKEPTKEDVETLIENTERIMKTIY